MSGGVLKPRDYQVEAIRATFDAWGRGVQRPAVVAATGLGKTVTFAHVINEWLLTNSRKRAVVLVHRDELARQAMGKLKSVAPHLNAGVVKAGENEVDTHVIVGSVQTLVRPNRREQLRDVGLVVVDECHHATARSYLDVMDHFGCFREGGAVALGVTATMKRADGIGLGQVWQEIVHERDTVWGIRHGYLVDVEGKRVHVDDMDMRAVRTSAGDYRAADLGDAFEDSSAPQVIAKAYQEHAADRPGVAFTPTVATAHQLADVMTEAGIEAKAIDGTMASADRAAVLRGHERGDVQVVTNCAVLTEGWDSPATEVCVVARNTQSAPLYVQMVGRVLRPNPAKASKRALVLDVVGVAAKHSLAGMSTLAGVDLADGETLLEAKERVEAELAAMDETADPFAPRRVEHVVAEDVDLFHGSRFVWGATVGGVRFISAGESYVVLIPEASGAYGVAQLSKRGTGSRWVEREIADLGYAMAWGEERAESVGSEVLTQKDRAWRSKPATVKAKDLARKLDLIFDEKVRGGVLADQIDQVFATRRIDRHVLPYLRKIGVKL